MTQTDLTVIQTPAPTEIPAEAEYAPPQRSESNVIVTPLESGDVLVSFIREGVRYAAVGTNEAHARAFIDEQPDMCRAPSTP